MVLEPAARPKIPMLVSWSWEKNEGGDLLLICSSDKSTRISQSLKDSARVDEIGVCVDTCPRSVLILEIFDTELNVGGCPCRLDGGEVRPYDASRRVVIRN